MLSQGHCSADVITCIYLSLTRPSLLGMLPRHPRINANYPSLHTSKGFFGSPVDREWMDWVIGFEVNPECQLPGLDEPLHSEMKKHFDALEIDNMS